MTTRVQEPVTLTSALLELRQLSCERDDRPLFSELNLRCAAGEVVQFAGPNGCGKTTLLRVLTGISDDFSGQILWRGKPLKAAQRWAFARELLYIGHLPGIKARLTPRENLRWYGASEGGWSTVAVDTALAELALYPHADTPCYQLSAGQLRRVALTRLSLSSASVWILDEPFTAIDRQGVAQLEDCIARRAESGGLVLLTSHQTPAIPGLRVVNLPDFRSGLQPDVQPGFGAGESADV